MKQRIALLGSTGSIGVQTLDIVRENSELLWPGWRVRPTPEAFVSGE